MQPDLAEGTLRRPVKPAVEEEVKEMVRTLAECPQRRSCLVQITDSDFAEPISMGSRPVYPSSFIVARPLPHLQLLEGNETQRAKTRVHPDILSCVIVYTNTHTNTSLTTSSPLSYIIIDNSLRVSSPPSVAKASHLPCSSTRIPRRTRFAPISMQRSAGVVFSASWQTLTSGTTTATAGPRPSPTSSQTRPNGDRRPCDEGSPLSWSIINEFRD